MFPYPSGQGLHVGHPEGYTATDILSRMKRSQGYNVLHPMGWDAFGLPAEQYALDTGNDPAEFTKKNIETFRRQINSLGFSYDWNREINTTDPEYYKWTQWIFTKLYEKGLAYEAEVAVNWVPALGTVISNEEVIDGKSERGNHEVIRKPMRQWMLKITEYADRLLDDLDDLDWPESIKEMQRNWIGRSYGANVTFKVANHDADFTVFTTRPDTLFGATYCVLAPELDLVQEITTPEQKAAIDAYITEASKKSDLTRTELVKEKTGVFTGAYAINPVNGKEVPIWISDYVLASYGTGAIMAVPAHDERDYDFAKNFGIENAQGEYIAFCDADDTIDAEYIENLYCGVLLNQVDVCVGSFAFITENKGEIISRKTVEIEGGMFNMSEFMKFYSRYMPQAVVGSPCNKLYRRSIVIENSIRFNTKIKNNEDTHFNYEFLAKCKTVYVSEMPYYNYINRLNVASASNGFIPNIFDIYTLTYNKGLDFLKATDTYSQNIQFQNQYYIGLVIGAINGIVNGKNDLTVKEKIEQIENICNTKEVKEAIKTVKFSDPKKTLIVFLIKKRCSKFLYYLVSLKK